MRTNLLHHKIIPLILAAVLLAACTGQPAMPPPGESATPRPEAQASPTPARTGVSLLADGVVQAAHPSTPLAFETSGRLVEVLVQPGEQVEKGDLLARLEESQSLDSLHAAVTSAELAVLRSQQALDDLNENAGIARSKTLKDIASYAQAVRDAQFRLENYSLPTYLQGLEPIEALTLMKEGLDAASAAFQPYRFANPNDPIRRARLEALNQAQSQYDAAVKRLSYVYDLQAAQANLEKALQDYDDSSGGPDPDALALAQGELANAEAQLALAQQDLDQAATRSMLAAPMDGVVLSVEAAPGAQVGAGTPVFTLLDAAALEFHTTNLSERDLALIVPGQRALVTLKAYPDQPIEATVLRIGWQAGAPLGDAATFPIVLALSPSGLELRPGMTGRVEIE
jgi:multidrug resistance efflux pump